MREPAATTWCGPRYTQEPFPPYRYIPRQSPHPLSDPAGHSYRPGGDPEPSVQPVAPEAWYQSKPYLFGVDLYNHGYWWEAHESWEGPWRLTELAGVQRSFLRGLIQAAVVHLKFEQRLARGFRRLRESGRAHLESVQRRVSGPVYMGLDVAAFLKRINAYYTNRELATPHDPRCFPYIWLH